MKKQVFISFFKDRDLRSHQMKSRINLYKNQGFSHAHAVSKAGNEVSNIQNTQVINIDFNPDVIPVSDIVHDIAKGRPFSFTIEDINQ